MGRSSAQPRHLAPTRQNIRQAMVLMIVAVMALAGALVSLPSTSASATDKTGGSNPTCTTEYEWVKKGTEYRWKTVYKEAKQLKGWYVELPNSWKQGDPNTWYDLPSEKQPPRSDQVAPTGTVPLSVYDGPRNVSTQYKYKTSYTEFFPSETGFSAGPPPAGKDWGNPIAQQSVIVDGPKWSATSPGQGWEKTGKSKQVNCFDWDWKYDNPTCTALTVKYPSNIPDGQANDANIRIVNLGPGGGEVTLNFHNNNGTWSGTKSFVYAEHPNWPGWTYYKVVWTQVGGTNYHWQGEVICGNPPTPKDASASVSVDTQATCTDPSTVTFDLVNATLDSEPVNTPGEHQIGVTATDGHLFADGSKTAEVEYTIEDKNPDLCEPVVVPNNGQFSVQQGCVASEGNNVGGGYVTFTFTNVVELKEGEVTTDAEFTYTDENGATQTVTVPANEVVVRTVVFPEDSGDHVVLVGLAGGEQEEVTVSTDCKPNPTPFTPPAPTFVDKCGLTDDGVAVIGTPVEAASSIDQDGNIHRSAVYGTEKGTYFVSDNTIDGKRDATVWFVMTAENAFIPEPGKNDTYVLEDGVAVWHYSFTNEACPNPTPTPTPSQTANPTGPSGAPAPAAPAPKPKQHSGLAVTGAEALTGLGVVALSLLLGGGALVVVRQRRKRNA